MGDQHVVHLPEAALGARGLRRLGRHLRARVDVVEREVAPHVAQLVAEGGEQLADDGLGLAAVRALVVAVLDQRHGRVGGCRAGGRRSGSTSSARSSELVGGAASWRARGRGREQRDDAERRPGRAAPRGSRRRGCRASPPRAAGPSKARLAISSETVKPMPATRAAAGERRPADRQPLAAAARAGRQPRRADDARAACRRRSRRRCRA